MKLLFVTFLMIVIAIALQTSSINAKKIKTAIDVDIDADVTVIEQDEDLEKKLEEMTRKKLAKDKTDAADGILKLKREEEGLKSAVIKATEKGAVTVARAKAIHALGKNVYQQGRFDEARGISFEILAIYEQLYTKPNIDDVDQYDHPKIVTAIGNIASVTNKMGLKDECFIMSMRVLNYILKEHGEESKEAVRQRAVLMSFGFVEEGQDMTHNGYTYKEYVSELEKLMAKRQAEADSVNVDEDEL